MSYLMIRYLFLLFIGKDRVFLLISRNNDLDALFKVRLSHLVSSVSYRSKRCLVDYICQLCSGCSRSHSGDLLEVYITFKFYFLSVYFQYILSSFKIRKLYRYPSVKTSGTRKGRIQRFRSISSRQDYNSRILLKTVHFGKQLV